MIAKNDLVTKEYLKKELKEFRYSLLIEIRTMMHETMESALENSKLYYIQEMQKYIGAQAETFRDDLRYYKDGIKTMTDTIIDHGKRILDIENRN